MTPPVGKVSQPQAYRELWSDCFAPPRNPPHQSNKAYDTTLKYSDNEVTLYIHLIT